MKTILELLSENAELMAEIGALRGDVGSALPGWDVCAIGDHLWRWTREADDERRMRVDVQLGFVVRALLEKTESYGAMNLGREVLHALPVDRTYGVREAQRLLEEKAAEIDWPVFVPAPDVFVRASGDCVCQTCGNEYRRHPDDPELGWSGDGTLRPFLKRLCDGTKVKL